MPDIETIDIDQYTIGLDAALATLERTYAALQDMHPVLGEMMHGFHDHTREWMDSLGEGTWPMLDPSTVANKIRQGYPEPERPLYATGELHASAAGAGPYTVEDIGDSEAYIALDWDNDGWNIPALHQEGVPWREVTQHRRSADGHIHAVTYLWHLPARQIFEISDPYIAASFDELEHHILP